MQTLRSGLFVYQTWLPLIRKLFLWCSELLCEKTPYSTSLYLNLCVSICLISLLYYILLFHCLFLSLSCSNLPLYIISQPCIEHRAVDNNAIFPPGILKFSLILSHFVQDQQGISSARRITLVARIHRKIILCKHWIFV